jgi:hypothetical protein
MSDDAMPPFTVGPAACTLPTAEQPLRVAEFDQLFLAALRTVQRRSATRLRLVLDRRAEATTRALIERESECCSFFAFALARAGDELVLDVRVPSSYSAVLDALADRAAETIGARP